MTDKHGFDAKKYIKLQTEAILNLVKKNKSKLYVEFGGKLLDDKHAARVLPGYREDAKMQLLIELVRKGAEVVFAVSAKDIIRERIRGDHKITYDKESVRIIDAIRKLGVPIKHLVISLVPEGVLDLRIKKLQKVLVKKGMKTYLFHEIENYEKTLDQAFRAEPFLDILANIVCIISPGGGSGKFGICLSQLYKEMQHGRIVDYVKVETFPLKNLSPSHPVNLAFMAASADFYDSFFRDKKSSFFKHEKGIMKKEKLKRVADKFKDHGRILRLYGKNNKGINLISKCITDNELVEKEASAEIARRLIRYKFEVRRGQEDKRILTRMNRIISLLCKTSS